MTNKPNHGKDQTIGDSQNMSKRTNNANTEKKKSFRYNIMMNTKKSRSKSRLKKEKQRRKKARDAWFLKQMKSQAWNVQVDDDDTVEQTNDEQDVSIYDENYNERTPEQINEKCNVPGNHDEHLNEGKFFS